MNELEIICHSRIPGMSVFFDTVDYRTPHFHPEWELIWLVDNSMTVSCGGGNFQADRGDLLLFQPNEPHEFHKIQENCTFLCLQVAPELLRLENDLVVDAVRLNPFLGEQVSAIREMLLEIGDAYLNPERFNNLFCIGQVFLIFHRDRKSVV